MPNVKLHHINMPSQNTSEVQAFYRDILGLETCDELTQDIIFAGVIAKTDNKFVHDGNVQFHLVVPDPNMGFQIGGAINPGAGGHIAFRTDDIEGVKETLRAHGVPFADYGVWSMKTWYQIFFHDPAGTIVEVHQVIDG